MKVLFNLFCALLSVALADAVSRWTYGESLSHDMAFALGLCGFYYFQLCDKIAALKQEE